MDLVCMPRLHSSPQAPVLLQTYTNQVGGHTPLLLLGDGVVCKPTISREKFFYESIPPAVRVFTPYFHGTVRVEYKQSGPGSVQYFARPMEADWGRLSLLTACPQPSAAALNVLPCSSTLRKRSSSVPEYVNPWSASCIHNLRKTDVGSGEKGEYIMLENLTAKFSSPSILDLKMGTRQHGDDSSPAKKELHSAKCASSTSLALGVRVCGMQRYDLVKRTFVFQDKYVGRKLDADGFHSTLRQYLFNGCRHRTDLVPDIVKMLKQLKQVVLQQDSYRFFSSSLLIVYEGDDEGEGRDCANMWSNGVQSPLCSLELSPDDLRTMRRRVDIRMIDFAHTTHEGFVNDPVQYRGPDNGYVLGLNTLIDAFDKMIAED